MATILEFPARVARVQSPNGEAHRQSCADIVIFPGIRYEREAEPAPKRGRRARHRDHLELED